MSSPPTSPKRNDERQAPPERDRLLAAIEQRVRQQTPAEEDEEERFARERDTRQNFRRLLDPGIVRGNSASDIESTTKTLLMLAENLLREPNNPKFAQFKPTNTIIKSTLVDIKGGLEYAVALGFRADVQNFQPLYVLNPTPRNLANLRIGAMVLREAMEAQTEAAERAAKAKAEEKAAKEQAAMQVKLAYEDDRKRKKLHDQLESQRRASAPREPQASTSAPAPFSRYRPDVLAQGGQTLSGGPVATDNHPEGEEPPAYGTDEDEAEVAVAH